MREVGGRYLAVVLSATADARIRLALARRTFSFGSAMLLLNRCNLYTYAISLVVRSTEHWFQINYVPLAT